MARPMTTYNLSDLTVIQAGEKGLIKVWKEHQQLKLEKKFGEKVDKKVKP